MLLLVLFAVAVVCWVLHRWINMKPKNFPPGPPWFPVVGSALSVPQARPDLKMEEWRETYGPVVGLMLGSQLGVAVCRPDAVFEALKNDDLQGRPDNKFFRERTFNKRLGVFFTDGPFWAQQRRFTLRHLRDFGFGKISMEGRILEEVEDLVGSLANRTVQVTELFGIHMVNVLWAVAAGSRFERHDARLKKLLEGVNETFRSGNPTGSMLRRMLPFLTKLAPGFTGYTREVETRTELQDFIREAVHQHRETLDVDNPRDFIDVYLREMDASKDPTFTEDGLVATVFDLFGAGAESVSNTLAFAVMYLVLHPDVQQKLHKELDLVVGQARRVSLEDRPQLPYLEAVITEVSRINTIAPLCPPHAALKDTTLCGYNIPQGTWLFISLWSIMHDREHWGDPDVFRPERFIDKETGKFVRDPFFINFGTGSRVCLGMALAKNNLFLFLASLLQDFTISLPPDEPKPSTLALPGFTTAPKPFRAHFSTR
ncbi:methyl farnesoate epoxidase-like [Schistocerca americana]|uniref:methyl farnesoate epoxidase-like n=1 Tax=Schistocerca americana TaxID=7009 RepID=UPI001F4F6E3A|nr:methyl farnesoate epoxidase-like [Schistocerca americana]